MYKHELIFISGPMGAGKTTFSTALFNIMVRKGHKACYRSFTAFSLFSYAFFKALVILLYGLKIVKYHENVRIHPSTLFILRVKKLPKLIIVLLTLLESLNMILSFYLKVILACTGRRVLIVDEGFPNMIANYIEIFGKNSAFLIALIIAFVLKLQQRFRLLIIYVDATDSVLLERWTARGHPAPTPVVNIVHHLKYMRLIRFSKTMFSVIAPLVEIYSAQKYACGQN